MAGEARVLNAVCLGGAATLNLVKKDDLTFARSHAYLIVLRTGQTLGQLCQLVIVGGEERLRRMLRRVVQMLRDGPGDGEAVEGRRAAPNLVEEDERTRSGVVEDGGRLSHLDHEGRAASGEVVRSSDACPDAVEDGQARMFGGHERAHLCEQTDKRRLTKEGALASHVRAGDDEQAL